MESIFSFALMVVLSGVSLADTNGMRKVDCKNRFFEIEGMKMAISRVEKIENRKVICSRCLLIEALKEDVKEMHREAYRVSQCKFAERYINGKE